MPGTSALEACEVVVGEFAERPFLAELPGRGPGGEMIGRTVGLLAGIASDLCAEPIPTGWRICGSPTRVTRQATSWLDEDLDRLQERVGDSAGSLKVQMVGPWTLAGTLETAGSQRALADAGLVAELGQAVTLAAEQYVAQVRRRVPNRTLILQIDEPMAKIISHGGLRTPSGFGRYNPVSGQEQALPWRRILDSSGADSHVLHSCGAFPFESSRLAGFPTISLDLRRIGAAAQSEADLALGGHIEGGGLLYAGVVPTTWAKEATPESVAESGWQVLDSLWRRTGLDRVRLRDVVVTATCGLAGNSWEQARFSINACLEIARRLNDD